MTDVIYSINGRFFKDFGVYIEDSKGLLDKPKPKPRKSYDWAEQHGKQIDLSPTKYEEQEIELKGWVEGDNWAEMKANFDTLLSEFDKKGLVRMLVDFGSVLVFDVYLVDGVELKKIFKEGKIIGRFTLKLKSPRPIKKVFVLKGNSLQISFTSKDWLVMNIDGVDETLKGVVSISRAIPNRVLSSTQYAGENTETTHYITLSGNIDQIKKLNTNAKELWQYAGGEERPQLSPSFSTGFSRGFKIGT